MSAVIWPNSYVAFGTFVGIQPDGIPRNASQAKLMEGFVDVRKVFHLNCLQREDLLYSRLKKRALKENRLDDADESVIKRRLEVYGL